MKTFILSVLALGFIWQASAITVTAYVDAPSFSTPDSGCKTPLPAGPIVSAGFTNPFNCALNACCFYQNFTMPGQAPILSWFKAFSCEDGQPGRFTYNAGFSDANCTSGGSNQTGTPTACSGNSPNDPRWTGVGALRVTCSPLTPPVVPPPQPKSLGALAFLSPATLAVAALAVFL